MKLQMKNFLKISSKSLPLGSGKIILMKLIFVFLSFLMTSCSGLIDPPKNLIAKDEMAVLVAEFAINEQLSNTIPGTNIENATRVVLKQKKIKAKDFSESYKYYTATGDLEKILNDAQEIILNKDPAAKKYIEKNLQTLENIPPTEK